MKKILSSLIIFILLISCKEDSSVSNKNNNKNINECAVFTNGSDPRLAEIRTVDGRKITFFGQRDITGKPINLSGYSISYLPDTIKSDIVTMDSLGRYSNIFLRTGEKLHINYNQNDSVIITVTGSDNSIHQINGGRLQSKAKALNFFKSNKINKIVQGSDKYINIKVTAKNYDTNIETNVIGSDAIVIVNINNGQGYNNNFSAIYNYEKELYTAPLPTAKYTFDQITAIDTTLNIIKKALEFACTAPISGSILTDKSVAEMIRDVICPKLEIPAYVAICLVVTEGVLISCTANEYANLLNNAYKYLSPTPAPLSAEVTVTSQHYKYGTQKSQPILVSQILQNTIISKYDIKITHLYSEQFAPTLTTSSASSITTIAAKSGGNISSDGGAPIIAKGVCWSLSHNPFINNNTNITNEGSGTGSYTSNLTGLLADTTYYIRAYATNSVGTAYGNEVNFKTLTNKQKLDNTRWVGYYIIVDGKNTVDGSPYLYPGTLDILEMHLTVKTDLSVNAIFYDGTYNETLNNNSWISSGTINSSNSSITLNLHNYFNGGDIIINQPWSISGNTLSGAAKYNWGVWSYNFTYNLTKQ